MSLPTVIRGIGCRGGPDPRFGVKNEYERLPASGFGLRAPGSGPRASGRRASSSLWRPRINSSYRELSSAWSSEASMPNRRAGPKRISARGLSSRSLKSEARSPNLGSDAGARHCPGGDPQRVAVRTRERRETSPRISPRRGLFGRSGRSPRDCVSHRARRGAMTPGVRSTPGPPRQGYRYWFLI